MCSTCQHAHRDCSGLDFKSMPVIEVLPTITVVRCVEFERYKEVSTNESLDLDEYLAEAWREEPELMDKATAEVKMMLSTEEGKEAFISMFVPLEIIK